MAHAYNPSTQEGEEDREFEASLGYIARARLKKLT
jgi:hypothetical protein